MSGDCCTRCKGFGRVPKLLFGGYKDCPECRGTGEIPYCSYEEKGGTLHKSSTYGCGSGDDDPSLFGSGE